LNSLWRQNTEVIRLKECGAYSNHCA